MRRQPARTLVLGCLVAIFCFTLVAGTMLGQKASQGTRLAAERLGADILFVPYGYDAKAQNALLRGEPSSFYMDGALAKSCAGSPASSASRPSSSLRPSRPRAAPSLSSS
jgi:putative ABC transport system permease protein